jgi:3-hydroxyacyl-[acyl-carrier-protein] dehydratase
MAQPLSRAIREILPHRYPFLLVDRVTEFLPGERIAATKHLSANDELLQGQFPGISIVPAVVLFELVTQLGAVLVMERPEMDGKVAMILQIPSAHMHELVRPGETLRLEARIVKMRATFGELRGAIFREDTLVGEGQMRFGVAEKSSLQLSFQS